MKKLLSLGILANVLAKTTTSDKTFVENVELEPSKESKYPKEVLEIHNEFSCAADHLLEEANNVLKEAEKANINKFERLEKLGFKQSTEVVQTKPLIQKANLSKEQLDLLAYYKREYPLNKFITEEQVKHICHKYNLVCSSVNRFKGFVPEKNLKEIEKFKLKPKDELGDIVIFIEETGKIEAIDATRIINDEEAEAIINYVNNSSYNGYSYVTSNIDDGRYGFKGYPRWTKLVNRKIYQDKNFKIQEALQCGLQICAPVKDMDISGLELVEGYKLQKKHIPDPVVLQPVRGGYLILTAWGDEASDPIVVNETMN